MGPSGVWKVKGRFFLLREKVNRFISVMFLAFQNDNRTSNCARSFGNYFQMFKAV